MRKVFALTLLMIMSAPALAEDFELGVGPGGFHVGSGHHHGWRHHGEGDWEHRSGYGGGPGYCRELRQACMHKEELGEEGMGNAQCVDEIGRVKCKNQP